MRAITFPFACNTYNEKSEYLGSFEIDVKLERDAVVKIAEAIRHKRANRFPAPLVETIQQQADAKVKHKFPGRDLRAEACREIPKSFSKTLRQLGFV